MGSIPGCRASPQDWHLAHRLARSCQGIEAGKAQGFYGRLVRSGQDSYDVRLRLAMIVFSFLFRAPYWVRLWGLSDRQPVKLGLAR